MSNIRLYPRVCERRRRLQSNGGRIWGNRGVSDLRLQEYQYEMSVDEVLQNEKGKER